MGKELTHLEVMVLDGLEGRNKLILDITDFRFPKSDILLWMEKQESFTARDVCKQFKIPHGRTHCHFYKTKGYIETIGTFKDPKHPKGRVQEIYSIVK
jgi:hypothetical protein